MTAVLTPSKKSFRQWCAERRIKQISSGKYIDDELEEYIPISKETELHGLRFKEYEVDNEDEIEEFEELVSSTRQRIY